MFSYASDTRICFAPSTQDGSSTLLFFQEQSFVTEQDTKHKWHEDEERVKFPVAVERNNARLGTEVKRE